MKQVTAPVIANIEVMPETFLLRLAAPEIAAAAAPGQFVMVRCGGDTLLRRPLSVHRTDGENIDLLFSVVGRGTQWLSRLEKGTSLDILGPLGNGFTIPKTAKKILLVAGGMGIAPLVFLADEVAELGYDTDFLIGTPTGTLPILDGLSPEICTFITEDGSSGHKGMVTDFLWEQDYRQADVIYACGPTAMFRTMAAVPELRGKNVQVSLEIMMGCGMGVCYGCTIKTRQGLKQVCKDGPVFQMEDVVWEGLGG